MTPVGRGRPAEAAKEADVPGEGTSPPRPGTEALLATQLAHDIRSPLAAILALAGSLLEELDGVVSERQMRHLQLLHNASISLDSLVDDVLELARPRAPGERLELVDFSIAETLLSVRDLLQPAADLSGAVIDLGMARGDHRRGLGAHLRRILLNLSSLPLRGGYPGVLEIRSEALAGDLVRFTIRSSEATLEPGVIETVKEVAFGRRPRGRSCFGTFGLELAFRLVDDMGSELEVETGTGRGTTFSFVVDLPVSAPRPQDA